MSKVYCYIKHRGSAGQCATPYTPPGNCLLIFNDREHFNKWVKRAKEKETFFVVDYPHVCDDSYVYEEVQHMYEKSVHVDATDQESREE